MTNSLYSQQTDVLIVGAGPTGLLAACQLAQYGVNFRIIDAKDGIQRLSKALSIQARTLEILENIGLATPILEQGIILDKIIAHIGTNKARELPFPTDANHSPYYHWLFIDQYKTEQLLLEKLTSMGVNVEWNTRLLSISQERKGDAIATIRKDNESHEVIEARYVIGADGASSTTRKLCGFEFDGYTHKSYTAQVDATIDTNLLENQAMISVTKDRFIRVLPIPGENKFRIITPLPQSFAKKYKSHEITFEMVKKYFESCGGHNLYIKDPEWLSVYKAHKRSTKSMQKRNIFLAGDSAHVSAPVGGQGMNLSMQDGWNLAWKLACVIQHGFHEDILTTYEQERSPIAQKMSQIDSKSYGMITEHNTIKNKIRYHIWNHLTRTSNNKKHLGEKLMKTYSEIDHCYSGGSGFFGSDIDGERLVGCRIPNCQITIEHISQNIFRYLLGPYFHIFVFSRRNQAKNDTIINDIYKKLGSLKDVCRVLPIEYCRDNQDVYEKFDITDNGIVIIRPDGYIYDWIDNLDTEMVRDFREHCLDNI